MNKYVITYALIGLIAALPLCARSEQTADQELQDFPTGGIRQIDIQGLQNIDTEMAKMLSQAPDDSTGKRSSWFPKLQVLKAALDQAVSSGKQVDVFKMIPLMAEFFMRDKTDEHPEHFLTQFEAQAYGSGYYIIMAAGAYIKQQNAAVDAATLSNFVKLFSVYGFYMEPQWEDQTVPIGEGGLIIINPAAVVSQLKAAPWKQAQCFLGDDTMTSGGFFAPYEPSGAGLEVLKNKYSQNRSQITAKFKELKSWILRQERVNGSQ